VVLIRALVAVIHAVLQAAATSLIAGFSLLIIALVSLAVLAGLITTLAGGLGLGGIRWIRRRRGAGESNSDDDSPST
jgi:ABC-type methionine transport system permease subunit